MQLQNLNIEGFGTLAQFKLPDLSEGLNVVYGGNGSGKSTVLHFLRGLLCGFQEARKLRLIPPLKGGHPGGSVSIRTSAGRFDVIRHARPDQSDTLAIHAQQAAPDEIAALRKRINGLDAKLVRTVFAVSGYEAHDLNALTAQAQRDGIDLTTRSRAADWVTERIGSLEQDPIGSGAAGKIASLEQRLKDLTRQVADEEQRQARDLGDWRQELRRLDREISQIRAEYDWLAQEIQGVETDLTEVETRLWSTRQETVSERRTVEVAVESPDGDWPEEVARIDREIANAQQVLRDLAASRMSLSIRKADLTGAEIPDQDLVYRRQRAALEKIEDQTNRLEDIVHHLRGRREQATCVCQPLADETMTVLERIRSQIWLMCQELGRLQTGYNQWLLANSVDSVDHCEQELIRQIQRLRLRRDELVHASCRSDGERVLFRTKHESVHCGCADHDGALTFLPAPKIERPVRTEVLVEEHVVTLCDARPGDADRRRTLLERRGQLCNRLRDAQARLAELIRDRDRLDGHPHQAFGSSRLAQLRYERGAVEQELADAREQAESLALLRTTLQRTREKMKQESASPVLEEASALLTRMTGERYAGFRFAQETAELRIVNQAGSELRTDALSRGTLEQAALCFRLALWNEYRRRGVILPLILDDVLADSDEDRLREAAAVLMEQARRHQIILMTCQEHLVDLFDDLGASCRSLPGSVRPARKRSSEPSPAVRRERPERPVVAGQTPSFAPLDRVQPDRPHWLSPEGAVGLVPSLGSQMARRLGALGVKTVGDLIDLDLEATELPLDSLQISARTLRLWQAEARLLCCVPNLTGRDAQLLVAIGILHPAELAQSETEDLLGRIRRFRTVEQSELALTWLRENLEWPSRDTVDGWIRQGRSARPYQRSAIHERESRARLSRNVRSRRRLKSKRKRVELTGIEPVRPAVKLHTEDQGTGRTWRFYLDMDSPIVDAPSIGPKTAERLKTIGVSKVRQLLNQPAREIAGRMRNSRITEEIVRAWQQQSALMCQVPELRGHDVQLLVACGFTDPASVAAMTPSELLSIVEPLATSKEGQRLLRSSKTPDLDEITEWIECARHSRIIKAA